MNDTHSIEAAEALARPDEWPDWPDYGLIDDIRPALAELTAGDRPFALATLVEVEGSSPRPPGCQMLIAGDGRVWGYVSGGCVEADLALRARTVLQTGTPEIVHYGRGSGNWDIQLTCGGRIGIFVQRLEPGDPALREVLAGARERRSVSLAIDLETSAVRALSPLDLESTGAEAGGLIRTGGKTWFVKHYTPAVRLLIVGADPVALALAELARPLGIAVHLNRPAGPATAPADLPDEAYHTGGPGAFLDELKPDPWTAVVCVSHDLDLDHAVLTRALRAPVLYAGALGSRRYRQERLDRLRADGVPEKGIARLRTPVGLDIGARTASEIALAVLADIVAARGPS